MNNYLDTFAFIGQTYIAACCREPDFPALPLWRQVLKRGVKGPLGHADDASLKPALRALVRGLERSEQGKAEELWSMYLTLFALLPRLSVDALGMAEDALE